MWDQYQSEILTALAGVLAGASSLGGYQRLFPGKPTPPTLSTAWQKISDGVRESIDLGVRVPEGKKVAELSFRAFHDFIQDEAWRTK